MSLTLLTMPTLGEAQMVWLSLAEKLPVILARRT